MVPTAERGNQARARTGAGRPRTWQAPRGCCRCLIVSLALAALTEITRLRRAEAGARSLAAVDRRGEVDAAAPSERGLDRVVNFSDAVVAIAITLVVLPLVDIAQSLKPLSGVQPGAWFVHSYGSQIAAAELSFLVIAEFWREHHAQWERAIRYTRLLVVLNLLWLATIVFLPVPTVLLFRSPEFDHVTVVLCIGALLLNWVASRAMQLESAAHCREPNQWSQGWFRLAGGWFPVLLLMALALVLAISRPAVGTRALFVLLLAFPLGAILQHTRPRTAEVSG
jgi:uncharacterized membrane protein